MMLPDPHSIASMKSSAKAELGSLISQFQAHLEEYKSLDYNEATLRIDFLNKFFHKVLCWDVPNDENLPPSYREVVTEDSIQVEGRSKSPDYSFRKQDGTRLFFVEAKKPHVNISKHSDSAFQLRRYGWNADLAVSILTSFEYFAVYDCSFKPKENEKPTFARLQLLHFSEYLQNFDYLWETFSRQAVLHGSLNQFLSAKKSRKGTASVDKDFLESLDTWRISLAKDVHKHNSLDEEQLNLAVQQIIDRLIFLRIAEDRSVEAYGGLKEILDSKDICTSLRENFLRADSKYNSGLFKQSDILNNIKLSNLVLSDIISGLYYPKSPYEFSVLPIEILGKAYEKFLGKQIKLTGKNNLKLEDKPEVRKAGGVYYTPRYIVDYIVKCTVGQLCAGKTHAEVSKIKILDPASGSGSFLICAYEFLLNWHKDYFNANKSALTKKEKKDVLTPTGELTTKFKGQVLLNNIYGVDVDRNAVEVTKLSLLLKCMEGETRETIQAQMQLFHERLLPTLDENIKCGNSLIDTDFYEFETDMGLLKQAKPFNWEREFHLVFKNGGFDAVIGNPPYIRVQRVSHSNLDYFFNSYKTPTSKMDLSLLFLERAFTLTRSSGLIGFICTSQWLTADYGSKLRKFLSTGRLHEIIDFGSLPVFEDASTYPAIVVLSNSLSKEVRAKKVTSKEQLNFGSISSLKAKAVPLDSLSEKPWSLTGVDISKCKVPVEPLSAYGKAYIGTKSGLNEAFVMTRKEARELKIEKEITLPYAYRGGEVESFRYLDPDSVIIYPYTESTDGVPELISEQTLKREYPNAYRRLLSKKSELQKRQDSRKFYAKGKDWYRHLRAGNFSIINSNKLAVKGISLRCNVGILKAPSTFDGARCPCVIIENSENYSEAFFLGILNSKLATYYLKSVCPPKLNNYIEFTARALSSFPIPSIDLSDQKFRKLYDKITQCVISLVELSSDENTDKGRTLHFESQIDKLVYQLYGLNADEIGVVEGLSGNVER